MGRPGSGPLFTRGGWFAIVVDMDPLLELAEQQHGLITLGQARSLGIGQQSVHRWASGPSWERLSDEVLRRRGSAPNRAQHVLAAVLDAGPGAFLSFASGAAWWRVPGPPLDPIGIVRVSRTSRPSGTGAEIHTVRSLPERWTTTLDAVPIVRPELLALHLFATEPYARAERWVERLWAMRLLSGPSLGAMLCDFGARGRNGIASVRRYLDDRGPGYVPAATGIESRTMQILRQVGIVVERQVDLGGEESWTGRVDFLVVGLPIIIEVQSELHHAALVDRVADDARRARLEADGFTVVELWDTEVWSHPSVAVARVAAAVATHRSVRSITTSEL